MEKKPKNKQIGKKNPHHIKKSVTTSEKKNQKQKQ